MVSTVLFFCQRDGTEFKHEVACCTRDGTAQTKNGEIGWNRVDE